MFNTTIEPTGLIKVASQCRHVLKHFSSIRRTSTARREFTLIAHLLACENRPAVASFSMWASSNCPQYAESRMQPTIEQATRYSPIQVWSLIPKKRKIDESWWKRLKLETKEETMKQGIAEKLEGIQKITKKTRGIRLPNPKHLFFLFFP